MNQQSYETITPLRTYWYFEFWDKIKKREEKQWKKEQRKKRKKLELLVKMLMDLTWMSKLKWTKAKLMTSWLLSNGDCWLLTTYQCTYMYIHVVYTVYSPNPKHILNGFVAGSIISILFREIVSRLSNRFLFEKSFECRFENKAQRHWIYPRLIRELMFFLGLFRMYFPIFICETVDNSENLFCQSSIWWWNEKECMQIKARLQKKNRWHETFLCHTSLFTFFSIEFSLHFFEWDTQIKWTKKILIDGQQQYINERLILHTA